MPTTFTTFEEADAFLGDEWRRPAPRGANGTRSVVRTTWGAICVSHDGWTVVEYRPDRSVRVSGWSGRAVRFTIDTFSPARLHFGGGSMWFTSEPAPGMVFRMGAQSVALDADGWPIDGTPWELVDSGAAPALAERIRLANVLGAGCADARTAWDLAGEVLAHV